MDKQALLPKHNLSYLRVYTSALKAGERFSDEPAGYLSIDGAGTVRVVGRPSGNMEALKALGEDGGGNAGG